MADDLTQELAEVDRKQAALLELVDELVRTPDTEKQQALVQRIAERSNELSQLCGDLEARARASSSDLRGEIEVVLTANQREQVKRETDVDMTSIVIRDDGGGLAAAMPSMTREEVFTFALAEAQRQAREARAREAARAEFDRIANELRRDAPSQVRTEIDRLLKNPQFTKAFAPPSKK